MSGDMSRQSLGELLEALGSENPTPGGGAAAALSGAIGASSVAMLARLTLARPKHADHHPLMQAIVDGAEEARVRLLDLAVADAAAYDAVLAAYRLPKETQAEEEARRDAIQASLRGAIETPLKTMEDCVELIGLAKNTIECGFKPAATDGAAGAELARTGMKIAAWNVQANLRDISDEDYAKATRTRLDEMLFMGTKICTGIDSLVTDLLR